MFFHLWSSSRFKAGTYESWRHKQEALSDLSTWSPCTRWRSWPWYNHEGTRGMPLLPRSISPQSFSLIRLNVQSVSTLRYQYSKILGYKYRHALFQQPNILPFAKTCTTCWRHILRVFLFSRLRLNYMHDVVVRNRLTICLVEVSMECLSRKGIIAKLVELIIVETTGGLKFFPNSCSWLQATGEDFPSIKRHSIKSSLLDDENNGYT